MKLTRLILNNFLSFQNAEINLSNRGLLLISGKNGSGKSSLISKAISWVLFGQIIGGSKGDSVIRSGNTSASVEIFANDAIIKRARPHSIEILDNCESFSFRSQHDSQEYINKRIDRDYNKFINADYFGQGVKSNFINETSKTQLELLEDILDINKLDSIIENIKNNITVLLSLEKKEELYKAGLEGERNKLQAQIYKLDNDLKDYCSIERLINSTILDYNNKSVLDRCSEEELLKSKLFLEKCIQDFNAENERYREQQNLLASIKPIKERICYTCNQAVDKNFTDRLIEKNNLIKEQLKIYDDINLNDKKLIYMSAKVSYDELEKKNKNYNLLLDQKNKELINIQAKIKLTKENILINNIQIDSTNSNITDSENNIQLYKQDINDLKFWQNIFSRDFKNFIIKETLPFIEERTRYHLNLLNNGHIEVKFSTIKELKSGEERSLFNINVKVQNGGNEYTSLSGGEKQIVSFAIGLTLSELIDLQSEPSNIMILDEPFTELDSINCENIINYLNNELSKKKETIILISNDDRMKMLVPNILEVEKDEAGVSKIND